MPHVAYMEITGGTSGDQVRAYVFEQETDRLMQEFSFSLGQDTTVELPEGLEDTIVSVPLDWFGIRAMELPMDDPESIRDVLPYELEGLVLGDPSGMVMDAVLLDSLDPDPNRDSAASDGDKITMDGPNSHVLAVYMEKQKLGSLLDSLKHSGIDPRAVTSSELGELVQSLRSGGDLSGLVAGSSPLEDQQLPDRARAEILAPTVNFRRGEFAYTKEAQKTRRMFIRTAALAVALVLALSGHMVLKAVGLGKEAAAIEAQTLKMYSALFPGEKPENVQGLRYKAEAKVSQLKEQAQLYREAGALDLLMSLKDTARQGLKLTEITVDSNAVILRGTADSPEAIHAFKADLGEFLDKVTIAESGAAASGGTGFSITARKRGY